LAALQARVAQLESLLTHFSRSGNTVTLTGANLQIVNGTGSTVNPNGLGNLIVGYNEERVPSEDFPVVQNTRTGSHNVIVGRGLNYASWGGIVVGLYNGLEADHASVIGGDHNTATATGAVVVGGSVNTASGINATVSGGHENSAGGIFSVVSGGYGRTVSGSHDWQAGGLFEDE
jgi:hypothetical protein